MMVPSIELAESIPQVMQNYFGSWGKYLVVFFSGFLVTFLTTPLVRWAALRLKIMDLPNERRIHLHPTPRAGGVAVILGFHVAALVALWPSWPGVIGTITLQYWYAFFVASSVLALVGLLDDARGIPPWAKLLGQILAASVMYFMAGQGFNSLLGFDLPPFIDYAITLFWYLAITNSFNLIDGLDGLASGLAAISAIGLALSFVFRRIPGDALVMLGLVGACLAFLRYNFHPASIFLGDTGSMFLGFALASMSLVTGGKSTLLAVVGIPLVAAGVPVFDTLLAIWRRSIRKMLSGIMPEHKQVRGIMEADKDHLHHRFLSSGLTQRHVALALYMINASMVLVGLTFLFFKSSAIGFFLIVFVIGVYVSVRHLARVELWDTGLAIISGLHKPEKRLMASLFYPVWDLLCMLLALVLAVRFTAVPLPDLPLREIWFMETPLWLAPVFIALAASRTYLRVWSLASLRDYLVMTFAFSGGVIVSLGLVLLVHADGGHYREFINRAVWFGSLSLLGMVAGRGSRMAVQEMMLSMVQQGHAQRMRVPKRTLIYGVNRRCMLLLRELAQLDPVQIGRIRVAGLLDDDTNVRGRTVRGYKVLGGWRDVEALILKHRIYQIIVTRELNPAALAELVRLSKKYQVKLLEWYYGLRVLDEDPLETIGRETVFSMLHETDIKEIPGR